MEPSKAFPSSKISYGYDAPGWIFSLLGIGLILTVGMSLLMQSFELAGWVWWVCLVVGILGILPLFLGCCMVAYSKWGKLRLRDYLLRQIAWGGDETVLDVGAGRGLMAIGAAANVPNGHVLGIDVWAAADLTGNTREAALQNAQLAGVAGRVDFIREDASRLSLPDDSVDVVLSVLCLHNIEPLKAKHAACAHIARVLKPGGRAIITDYIDIADTRMALERAGLTIERVYPAHHISLGITWVIEGAKPVV